MAPAPDLPDPIGPYRFLRPLSQGGMASVYEVEFGNLTDLNDPPRRYALKLIEQKDEDSYERFKREILICMKLHHPNICQMVDWGLTDDGMVYLVMELLEGRDLADHIKAEAPMPLAAARPIVVQILEGLSVVHAAGIVHRDLKPGNIFCTLDGTVKIMDFGMARKPGVKSLTPAGMVVGTWGFLSPEQLVDSRHVDHRTDLYNVGVIFFKMLTGYLPYRATTLYEGFDQIQKGAMISVSSVVPELPSTFEPWLEGLLHHDRDTRFQSARAALDAISF